MTALAESLVTLGIRRATVESTSVDDPTAVTVGLGKQTMVARLGLAGVPAPGVGDQVLVAATLDGECFVIGVFGSASTLRVEQRGGTTVLAVDGDLELRAASGSVRIEARDGLELRGGREALIAAGRDGNEGTAFASSLLLRGSGVRVEAPALDATFERAEVTSVDAAISTGTLSVAAKRATQTIGLLEVRANKIIERAKNGFRDVEEQMQTRAGRMRFVAEQTYTLMSKRVLLKAHEDVKVKAEKIYLG